MTFNSLKTSVYKTLQRMNFNKYDEKTNHVNKILTGVLLINNVQKILKYDPNNNTDAGAIINEYGNTFKNIAESLKGTYISYKLIYNEIVSWNIGSILEITAEKINKILPLYQQKEIVKEFSPNYFSQYMYNITGLNDAELHNLEFVHGKIISPMMKYYINEFNITPKNISLDVENIGFRGKIVYLAISGISNSKIMADIERDIFKIKDYIYSYTLTSNGFIKLIIK